MDGAVRHDAMALFALTGGDAASFGLESVRSAISRISVKFVIYFTISAA